MRSVLLMAASDLPAAIILSTTTVKTRRTAYHFWTIGIGEKGYYVL
jgi:hypothetical protein